MQFRSTFSRVRLVWNPEEFIGDMRARMLSAQALGLFMWMIPYAVQGGLPAKPSVLFRFSPPAMGMTAFKRAWAEVEQFFELRNGEWWLKAQPWLEATRAVDDRQPLRHLYPQLIAFWGEGCVYCGNCADLPLVIEHITPRARGGSDAITNLTLACWTCNSAKHTMTAAEFGFPDVHDRAMRQVQ